MSRIKFFHLGWEAIFVQPFDRRGDRIQVSANGGIGPLWRDDSRELYDDSRELYYEGLEGLIAAAVGESGAAELPSLAHRRRCLQSARMIVLTRNFWPWAATSMLCG